MKLIESIAAVVADHIVALKQTRQLWFRLQDGDDWSFEEIAERRRQQVSSGYATLGHRDAARSSRDGYRRHESTQQEDSVECTSTFPEKCRYADGCWRPLCPVVHSRARSGDRVRGS